MITSNGLQHLGFAPEVDYVLQDDGDGTYMKEWLSDKPQPSLSDIETGHVAWENDHARKRKAEYPSIDELTVALWEGVVEERMSAVTALETVRQAVKTKYPK